ncbi:MAG: competence protein CoiA family protein [Ignavibacteriales bacterium]|nr:competence protein CoiA family protein [Ignavibacteriales bacterium]
MLIAINESGDRTKPYKKGIGLCPICMDKVQAVCGPINKHHWRHAPNPRCDPWQEHETEWHRRWKSEFPEDWQEIIINKNGEKHRADIKTTNELVVEFQNSSISADIIKERETFYEKIIWLINANNFKDNFKFGMKAPQDLVENSCLRIINENLKKEKEEIDSLKSKIQEKNIEYLHYVDTIKNIVSIYQDLLNRKCDYHYPFPSSNKLFNELKGIRQKQAKVYTELEDLKLKKKTFLNYEKCPKYEYKDYSIISFADINKLNFRKCKVIESSTIHELFPMVYDLNSENDFQYFKSHPNKYKLIINLTDSIRNIDEKMEVNENEMEILNSIKDNIKKEIYNSLSSWLIKKKKNLKKS